VESQTSLNKTPPRFKLPTTTIPHPTNTLFAQLRTTMSDSIRRRHTFFIDFNDADSIETYEFQKNALSTSHFGSKREDKITIPFPFTSVEPSVSIFLSYIV
jgi:hypothetical protein